MAARALQTNTPSWGVGGFGLKVCFPAQLRLVSRCWTGSLDREVENPWLACQRVRMSFYAKRGSGP